MCNNFACIKITDNAWKKELLKRGYAEYDKKTGLFSLCSPDDVLFNLNDLISNKERISVKISDYLRKLEEEVDAFQKASETIIKNYKQKN